MNINKIMEEIRSNNGITLNRHGVPVHHKEGYYVSVLGLETIPSKKDTLIRLKIRKYLSSIEESYFYYLGIWINNGKCYLDISIHINDKWRAKYIGKLFSQKSIYDCKRGRAITL